MKIILQDVCQIINKKKSLKSFLSRQKELAAGSEAIQQKEFAAQFQKLDVNGNATHSGSDQSMVFLTIYKNQRNKTKIFTRKINSPIKDGKL